MTSTSEISKAHENYYQNVEGPIGGSERFEWIFQTFFEQTQGQKILEIGCGEGSLLALLSTKNKVYGADISSSGVEKTREKGITCHLSDASNEPLPFDDSFLIQSSV